AKRRWGHWIETRKLGKRGVGVTAVEAEAELLHSTQRASEGKVREMIVKRHFDRSEIELAPVHSHIHRAPARPGKHARGRMAGRQRLEERRGGRHAGELTCDGEPTFGVRRERRSVRARQVVKADGGRRRRCRGERSAGEDERSNSDPYL